MSDGGLSEKGVVFKLSEFYLQEEALELVADLHEEVIDEETREAVDRLNQQRQAFRSRYHEKSSAGHSKFDLEEIKSLSPEERVEKSREINNLTKEAKSLMYDVGERVEGYEEGLENMQHLLESVDSSISGLRDELEGADLGSGEHSRVFEDYRRETLEDIDSRLEGIEDRLEDIEGSGVNTTRREAITLPWKIGAGIAGIGAVAFAYESIQNMGSDVRPVREPVGTPAQNIYEVTLEEDSAVVAYLDDIRRQEELEPFGEMWNQARSYDGDVALGFDDDKRRVDLVTGNQIGYSIEMAEDFYRQAKQDIA